MQIKSILNIFKDIPPLYFFLRSILLLLLFLPFLPRIFKCRLSFSLFKYHKSFWERTAKMQKKIIPVIIYIVSVCCLSFYSSIRKIFFNNLFHVEHSVRFQRHNGEKHHGLCFPGADSLTEETVNQVVMDHGDTSYAT